MPLGIDMVSPLGFSGRDVLAAAQGAGSGLMSWVRGGTTPVALEIVPGAEVRYLVMQSDVPGARECPNALEVDTLLSLTTGDLAEVWVPATLRSEQVERVHLHAELPVAELAGSYDVTGDVPTDQLSAALPPYLIVDADYGERSGTLAVVVHLSAREGGTPFPNGMSTITLPVGTADLDVSANITDLHRPCPEHGCAAGQTCMRGAGPEGFATCEIPCASDTDCPSGLRCELPPVVPGSLANICTET